MPIETNLNTSPYHDDFNENKDFYKILFRPGVSLQARELTQLQSMMQNQIERFGNHVFKSGTIISGVNFSFNNKYDYVKILDLQVDGQPVNVNSFIDLNVVNSSNLVAKIVNVRQGFESRDPDTNYLYLKYVNSGSDSNTSVFTAGDIVTVYDDRRTISTVDINNGSIGFSNSDSVHFTSALVAFNSNVAAGANIVQVVGANTANLYVIESNNTFGTVTVDNVTYSNAAGFTILKVKPLTSDLTSASISSNKWAFRTGYSAVQGSNTASIVAIVGSGAGATVTTDGSGIVIDVSMTSEGSGYEIPPSVYIKSTTGTVGSLDLSARNYKTQVTIAGLSFTAGGSTPVGNGYSFSVTEGIIYQKGYFLRVDPQTAIVNAYSSNVDSITVGFSTNESVVNSFTDSSLLDLATGTPNYSAPGANRLKMVPTLVVSNTVDVASNTTFFPLVEFRDGVPHKQNFATQYGQISKEFEQRTYEASGSFVVDQFQVSSKERSTWSNTSIDLALDPGIAYIEGRRVQTLTNSFVEIDRADTFNTTTNQSISFNYGSYVVVNELSGYFNAKAGEEISLYSTASQYITNRLTTITPTGSSIGTARVRAVVFDSGIPGTSQCRYRVYLFEVRLNQGSSFKDVRTLYYAGTPKGIADAVLTNDTVTGLPTASLVDGNRGSLVFPTGSLAVKSIESTNYFYASANASANIGTTGVMTLTSGDTFYYGNNVTLSSTQRRDLIILPTSNAESTNTVTSVTINNGASNVVLSATGLTSRFNVGDYVRMFNASNTAQTSYTQVTLISNATHMTVANGWSYATISTGTATRHFPAFVPIPTDDSRVSANTSADGQTLSINFSNIAGQVAFSGIVGAAAYFNSAKQSTSQITKNVARGLLVKIDLSTHSASTIGPWCLGIPDAFRLNKVYVGSNSSVNTGSSDITKYFFLDNGQLEDYYGHSHIGVMNNNAVVLNTTDWLLVEIDAFTLPSPTDAGYFSINSYPLAQNNSPRSSLGNSAINIMEVPEFRKNSGTIIDLRDSIDFRPRVTATSTVTSVVGSASVNPANTIAFGTHDKLFPVPDSVFTYDNNYYLQRIDNVVIDVNNVIRVLKGVPDSNIPVAPDTPVHSMSLARVYVPPYPSLPLIMDPNIAEFALKKVGKDAPLYYKLNKYTISHNTSPTILSSQTQRYTMRDIEKIDRRVQNLEYYVTLNQIEKKTKDLVIPSSVNPTIDRFKNGFFVDNFFDYYLTDVAHPEFRSCINQVEGTLDPIESTLNFQCRFDYADSLTRSNITYGDGSFIEPGIVTNKESIITLPVVSHATLINQSKFTSPVNGDGTNTRFIGTAAAQPSNFRVLVNVEVRLTGEDAGAPPPPPPAGRGGCKIICTKLHELGLLEDHIYAADELFGEWLRENDPYAYYGYVKWASVVVDWMDKEGPQCMFWIRDEKKRAETQRAMAIRWAKRIATPWAQHMAYKMGVVEEDSKAGSLIMKTGLFVSRLIGKFTRTTEPTKSVPLGYLMWATFGVFWLIAGLYPQGKAKE